MWRRILGGVNQESEEAKARREESLRRLKAGGLPLDAEERLQDLASRQGTPQELFTGTPGIHDLLLLRKSGYVPLGQVMGSVLYNVNASYSSGVSGELQLLTKANNESRLRALARLKQEAVLLGATGVLDVKLEVRKQNWVSEFNLLEVTAVGTAVREENAPVRREKPVEPFLTNLTGAGILTLQQAGYRPLGLAVGNCAYYKVGNPDIAAKARAWNGSALNPLAIGFGVNMERTDYTEGIYAARNSAMARMEDEARAVKAEGVVGVTVTMENHTGAVTGFTADLYCHFVVMGTAIGRLPGRRDLPEIALHLPMK